MSASFWLRCSDSLIEQGSEQANKMPLLISVLIVGSVEYTFWRGHAKTPNIVRMSQIKAHTPIDDAQKANFEVSFIAIKSDHFQNDAKPYEKRVIAFVR